MASPAPTAIRSSVVPSEVGWQFVSQYYTFVNKQPHRLHCFYTKNSTYTHGVEGEDSPACHGQQEIHNKILSIGFQDCKVFIHSVDAQSSASAGIIIQVIGEMSNSGEAWRKFVQTFFLAEQPNGYFVLNDVFRYLKEESSADDDGDEDAKEEAEAGEEEAAPEPAPTTQLHDVPEHPPAQPEPEPVVSLPPSAPQETAAPEPVPVPEPPAVNGTHVEEKTPEAAKETTQLPSPSPEPEPEPAEEPEPEETTPARGLTPAPAPAPAVASAPAASPAPPATEKPQAPAAAPSAPPAPTQPAQPAAPPAPKTWANLAAANSSKWGQVSADARGVSTSAKPTTPTPKPAPAAPVRKEEPPIDTSNLSPQAQAAMAVNTAQCFIKLNDWVRESGPGNQAQSSAESVSPAALKEVLTARFGAIKELEVVRSKACAFLEFNSVESARRAILASLPVNQGGEGGIRIGEDTPNERAPRITVEMRKERGDRPASGGRGRAGGPEQRGSFRGGRGGRGRGESRPGAPQAAK